MSFGGAQDIGELRAILERGEIPGPSTFDANGFFNEHYNAHPPADCDQALCISPGLSVGRAWIDGAHQTTLQLSLTTPLDPSMFERLPMNLVVVVDHSGSMASDGRLDKVKVGLHALIDNLGEADRLAIVEFDDVATVDIGFGEALDRTTLHAIVSRMQPRGSTNIFDGLQQGFLLVSDALTDRTAPPFGSAAGRVQAPAGDRQNRVILLSDGLATAGNTSQPAILEMATTFVARGIGLTTIGVGADFDVDLMRGLAEQGAGNFYFLEDPTAATEVFTEELDFFMQPIALDVVLQAVAAPGYTFGDAVGSRLWASDERLGVMKIPAVFVASRTTQTGEQGRRGGGSMIFLRMAPIEGVPGKVAEITLQFRAPGSEQITTQTVQLDYTTSRETTPEDPYLSAPEMAERFAMYNMFLGIRAATLASPPCATAILRATRSSAMAWNNVHADPDLAADLELVNQYLANLAEVSPPGTLPVELSLDGCTVYPMKPIDPGPYPIDEVNEDHGLYCSSGSAAGGLPIALGALLAIGARRRRRG